MVRESFSRYIKEVEKEISQMSEMVITATNRSIEALKARDTAAAEKIVADDAMINQKRWDIEERCIDLIATQQPVASDLREIIAALNIITELERMGDYAEGIAKIVILQGQEPLVRPLVAMPIMGQKATDMLKRSIEAFLKRDGKAAEKICDEDDEIDMLYDQVYRELLTYMLEDPKTITRATYLIWAAHNLERIADRVTNICERIVFLVTGSMPQAKISRY